ncbi:ComEA family DNA-binding protein [Thalassotalea fusca]
MKILLKISIVLLGLLFSSLSTGQDSISSEHSVIASDEVGLISLNQANVEQLSMLKGIGAKKAMAIIAYREEFGEFKTLEGLLNVKGIGKAILEINRTRLTL